MLRSLRSILAVAALLAGLAPAAAAPIALHRGVGLHEWLGWSPVTAAGAYVRPPYGSVEDWLSRYRPLADWPGGNELERIRSFGFDFIRLTVDPGPMLSAREAERGEALAVLRAAVGQAVDAGLKVVFNYHPNDQIRAYEPRAIEGRAGSPAIEAYVAMAAETAAMLAGFGAGQVAIEPFNEPAYYPCDASGSGDWQRIVERQVEAIRAVAPDITIVVTGACGGDVHGLVDLDATTFDDGNILYSFHMYEPHSFTHQRLENGWMSGIPWPASVRSRETVLAEIDDAMLAAGSSAVEIRANRLAIAERVEEFFRTGYGPDQMEALFDEAVSWAREQGIPAERLFVGEFGVIDISLDGRRGAYDADRVRYLSAVVALAARHGMAWSFWEYGNPYGMSFIRPEGPAMPDLSAIDALGLDAVRKGQ